MTDDESDGEGLRARKQRRTRQAIHRAAVELASERGPDAATVADISDRVGISPRTFFNYFPTKEDAIVGMHEGLPTDAELDRFRAGTSPDLIGDVFEILRSVFPATDDDLLGRRRALMTEHPQLIQRQWARLMGVEARIAGAVADRMRAAGVAADDVDDAALALVVTCNSVLRLSIRKAVADDAHTFDVRAGFDDTLRTLREVLRTLP